jgi:hypothetical protein
MALHREGAFSKPGFSKHEVTHENVFEEIPVILRSSNLTRVLLHDLHDEVEDDADRLDLSSSAYVVMSLYLSITSLSLH